MNMTNDLGDGGHRKGGYIEPESYFPEDLLKEYKLGKYNDDI